MNSSMFESSVRSLPLLARGKVRDIYEVDDEHLLIVTTDRLSAYDVILPDPVPDKGRVLTRLSNFWFGKVTDLVPNHLSDLALADVIRDAAERKPLEGRAIVVQRLRPLPIEAVVRGYLIGSGWRDYQRSGAVCGIALPPDLPQAAKLPEPLFTPATKAAAGDHDENIDFATTCELVGEALATRVRDASIRIYERARDFAAARGIIVADTKFEFGLDESGKLYIIDELLTPDSSRFWPSDRYATGISPPSFDKQFVRDYLDTLEWNKQPPAPTLPETVANATSERYLEAYRLLTGKAL